VFREILLGLKTKYLNISVIGIGREVIQGCSGESLCRGIHLFGVSAQTGISGVGTALIFSESALMPFSVITWPTNVTFILFKFQFCWVKPNVFFCMFHQCNQVIIVNRFSNVI